MDRLRTKTWKDGWETVCVTRTFERDGVLMWGIKHPSQRDEEVALADPLTSLEPMRRFLLRVGVPERRGYQILTWLISGRDPDVPRQGRQSAYRTKAPS